MQRVLIGVDDTDTPEEGATWTLVHNIARAVEDEQSVYLSHTIVQLFPVPYRTKNCVSIVVEFATTDTGALTDGSGNFSNGIPSPRKPGWRSIPGSPRQKNCLNTGER